MAFWTPGIQMFVHKTWLEFLSKEGLMRKERNCLLAPAAAPLRDENVMRWRGADGGRRPLIFHWEGAGVLRRLYWNEGMHLTYQHLFLLTKLPILGRRDLSNKRELNLYIQSPFFVVFYLNFAFGYFLHLSLSARRPLVQSLDWVAQCACSTASTLGRGVIHLW